MAGTQSCGLMSAQFESMVKRMQHGFASRAGLTAAALAASGYVGIKRVFEREYGGWLPVFGEGHHPNASEISAGLGTVWETARIAVKAYSAMGLLHAGIDAARALALGDRRAGSHPVVVVVTDGRATWARDGRDPVVSALESARACRGSGLDALVVDCEATPRPLGVARALAEAMGARYVAMGSPVDGGAVSGGRLAEAIWDSIG